MQNEPEKWMVQTWNLPGETLLQRDHDQWFLILGYPSGLCIPLDPVVASQILVVIDHQELIRGQLTGPHTDQALRSGGGDMHQSQPDAWSILREEVKSAQDLQREINTILEKPKLPPSPGEFFERTGIYPTLKDVTADLINGPGSPVKHIEPAPAVKPADGTEYVENHVRRSCGHIEGVYVQPADAADPERHQEQMSRLIAQLNAACHEKCTQCQAEEIALTKDEQHIVTSLLRSEGGPYDEQERELLQKLETTTLQEKRPPESTKKEEE